MNHSSTNKPRLLIISWEWPPATTPNALQTSSMAQHLSKYWDVEVITQRGASTLPGIANTLVSASETPGKGRRMTQWIADATATALQVIAERRPAAILISIMPYENGDVGLELKRRTGLPVAFYLGDSPTCDDMHPVFPSRRKFEEIAKWEDSLVQQSDAMVYVSQRTADRIRRRNPADCADKLHMVRRGAPDLPDWTANGSPSAEELRLVYIGGMSGWTDYRRRGLARIKAMVRSLVNAVKSIREYQQVELDLLGSSPVYIGRALQTVASRHPTWRVGLEVYGELRPRVMIEKAMQAWQVGDVVTIGQPLPHHEALSQARSADLLFMCLPGRTDGTGGCRISAKTYEYLSIDRPILAAVPDGENRDFLSGKPGVDLVYPDDVEGMVNSIEQRLEEKRLQGQLVVDRAASREQMHIVHRAEEMNQLLQGLQRATN